MSGLAFHLVTRHTFERRLEAAQAPEMHRVPLEQLVLRIKVLRYPGTAAQVVSRCLEPPAPGEREAPEDDSTLAVSLRLSSELAEPPFDVYRRRIIVDIIYRSKGTGALKRARALDAAIRSALTDGRGDYGLGWTMGSTAPVLILSSQVFGGLGPVSRDAGQGATDLAKYLFEVQAS